MASPKTLIGIEVVYGSVDDDDRRRAEAAAMKVFADRGVTVDDVYTDFRWQWAYLETDEAAEKGLCQDYEYLTGPAKIWTEAEKAADAALTEGWKTPGAASCGIF